MLHPTSRPKWPAVVKSLMSCTLHQSGEKGLSTSQNRLEIEREGERERGKKAYTLSSPIPVLPLHRICIRADRHMGDTTFFKESEADFWPFPPTPHPHSLPVTHKLHVRMSDHFFISKSTVGQHMGHWREEASKWLNLSSVNVYVCVSLLMLASCPISSKPF